MNRVLKFIAVYLLVGSAISHAETYRILAFNVETLYLRVGFQERVSPSEFVPASRGAGRDRPQYKSPQETQRIADIIKKENPDFAILTEVEDQSVDRFNDQYLNNAYDSYCERGNDHRLIDIALLVKKSSGLKAEFRSHKHLKWMDPVTRQLQPVFARDYPVLILRKPGDPKPKLILAGVHSKSKRDRPGDRESRIWRAEQYRVQAQIIRDLAQEFPDVTIVSGGDHNLEIRDERGIHRDPEVNPLFGVMKDVFSIAPVTTPIEYRVTHSFFPNGNPANVIRQQLDTFTVLLAPGAQVLSARVVFYDGCDIHLGGKPRFPMTYDERSDQPSDHNPIVTEIRL